MTDDAGMNGMRKMIKQEKCTCKASIALKDRIWCDLCVYLTIMLSDSPIISKQVKMQKRTLYTMLRHTLDFYSIIETYIT